MSGGLASIRTVRLLPFGIMRERMGRGPLSFETRAENVAGLLDELWRTPELLGFSSPGSWLRVAIGDDYVERNRPIFDGEEIALIPPVSGGSGGYAPFATEVR